MFRGWRSTFFFSTTRRQKKKKIEACTNWPTIRAADNISFFYFHVNESSIKKWIDRALTYHQNVVPHDTVSFVNWRNSAQFAQIRDERKKKQCCQIALIDNVKNEILYLITNLHAKKAKQYLFSGNDEHSKPIHIKLHIEAIATKIVAEILLNCAAWFRSCRWFINLVACLANARNSKKRIVKKSAKECEGDSKASE